MAASTTQDGKSLLIAPNERQNAQSSSEASGRCCLACHRGKSVTDPDDEEAESILSWLGSQTLKALSGGSATLTAFLLFLGTVMAIVGVSLQLSLGADSSGSETLVVTFENGNTTNAWNVMYAVAIALFIVPFANAVNFVILGTLRWYLFSKVFIVILYVSAFDNGPLTLIMWAIASNQVAIRLSGLPPLGALSSRLLVLFIVCGFVLGLKNLLIAILQGRGVLDEFKVKVQEAVQKLVVLQNLSAAAVSLAGKRSRLLKQFYTAQQEAAASSSVDFDAQDGGGAVLDGEQVRPDTSYESFLFTSSRQLGGLPPSAIASLVPAATVIPDAAGTGSTAATATAVPDGAGVASVFPSAVSSLPSAALQGLPPLSTSRARARGNTVESVAAVGTSAGAAGVGAASPANVLAVVNESGLLSTLSVNTPAMTGGTTSRARHTRDAAPSATAGTPSGMTNPVSSPGNPRQPSTRRMQRTLSMAVVLQPNRVAGSDGAGGLLNLGGGGISRGSGSRSLISLPPVPSSSSVPAIAATSEANSASGTFFTPDGTLNGASTASLGGVGAAIPAASSATSNAATSTIASTVTAPPPKIDTSAQAATLQETTQVFFDVSDESATHSTPVANAEDLRDVQLEESNYAVLSEYIEAGQFSLFDANGRIVAIRNAAHAKRIIHGIFTALDAKNSGTIAREQLLWDGDGWSSPLGPGWSDDSVDAAFVTIDAANAVSFTRADLIQFTENAVSGFQALRGTLHSLSTATQALNLVANLLLSIVFTVFAVLLLDINVQPLLVSISAVVLSLSFAFARSASNFVDSTIFVLVTRPYDLGDRVRFNNSVAMYVRKMDLYSTTFERNDGTQVVFANTVLSAGEIRNERRSGYASVQIAFDMSMDATPEQLEALAAAAVSYVRDRPTAWRSGFISFQLYTINTERNSFSAGFWLRHKLPFQNSSVVHGDAGRFMLFLAKTLQRLELRYSLPTQPVQIHAGVADNAWKQFHESTEPPAQGSTEHEGLSKPVSSAGASGHGFAGMTELLNRTGVSRLPSKQVASPEPTHEQRYKDAIERLQSVENAAKEWQDIVLGDVSKLWRMNLRKFTAPPLDASHAAGDVDSSQAAGGTTLGDLLQSAAAEGAKAAIAAMQEQRAAEAPSVAAPGAAAAGSPHGAPHATASTMSLGRDGRHQDRRLPSAFVPHRWDSHQLLSSAGTSSLPPDLTDLPVFGPSNRPPAQTGPPAGAHRHGIDVHNRVKQFGGFDLRPTADAAVPPPRLPERASGIAPASGTGRALVRSASWSRGDRLHATSGDPSAAPPASGETPLSPGTASRTGFSFGRSRNAQATKKLRAHEI